MVYTKIFAAIVLSCLLLHSEAGVAKRSYESRMLQENLFHTSKSIPDHSDACCLIPYCDSPHHCYDSFSCGYICSQGRYQAANPKDYGTTPGYRLKPSYHKFECRFDGECKLYEFKCDHCPDPDAPFFHIQFVPSNCVKCYH